MGGMVIGRKPKTESVWCPSAEELIQKLQSDRVQYGKGIRN
jgi:hypothetical protein